MEMELFDPSLIKNNHGELLPTFFILGRRGVGKTFLVKDLLWHSREINQGIVITSDKFEQFYEKFIPQNMIHHEYERKLIEDISGSPHFMVLENCFFDNSVFDDELLCECFNNPNILLIMTLQYPLDIPIRLRGVADYVFIFREPTMSNRLRIYQNFVDKAIPTFDLFCKIMDKITETEYQCLVIDTATQKTFLYKANTYEDKPNSSTG